jgi:hypothetical protein
MEAKGEHVRACGRIGVGGCFAPDDNLSQIKTRVAKTPTSVPNGQPRELRNRGYSRLLRATLGAHGVSVGP